LGLTSVSEKYFDGKAGPLGPIQVVDIGNARIASLAQGSYSSIERLANQILLGKGGSCADI